MWRRGRRRESNCISLSMMSCARRKQFRNANRYSLLSHSVCVVPVLCALQLIGAFLFRCTIRALWSQFSFCCLLWFSRLSACIEIVICKKSHIDQMARPAMTFVWILWAVGQWDTQRDRAHINRVFATKYGSPAAMSVCAKWRIVAGIKSVMKCVNRQTYHRNRCRRQYAAHKHKQMHS